MKNWPQTIIELELKLGSLTNVANRLSMTLSTLSALKNGGVREPVYSSGAKILRLHEQLHSRTFHSEAARLLDNLRLRGAI